MAENLKPRTALIVLVACGLLIELMILVVGRNFTVQYMWAQHERQALANGIAPAAVEAIRERRAPAFDRDVHALRLHHEQMVSDEERFVQ